MIDKLEGGEGGGGGVDQQMDKYIGSHKKYIFNGNFEEKEKSKFFLLLLHFFNTFFWEK